MTDEWHPPAVEAFPTRPESFPAAGVNSLAPIASRALARLIDAVLVSLPTLAVVFAYVALVAGLDADTEEIEEVAGDAALLGWTIGVAFASAVLYETLCIARWGQTLGKLIFRIRVARQANGRCPQWWEAAIRVALPGVVAAIPHPAARAASLVLYGVAIFDPLRRSLPDRAAGTVVVRAR